MSRHHRWVALVWLVIVAFGGYLGQVDQKEVSDNFRIPDTGSQSAYDLLQERFSSQNAATATVVFSVPEGQKLTDPANAAAVAAATGALGKVDGVTSVPDPLTQNLQTQLAQYAGGLAPAEAQAVEALGPNLPPSVSSDGRFAYVNVTFDKSLPDLLEQYPISSEKAGGEYPNP